MLDLFLAALFGIFVVQYRDSVENFVENGPMKTLLTTSILAAICAAPVYAAEIYRTVDKDGNVVFTDVPTSDRSESVELQKTSEYTPVVQPSTNRTPRRSSACDQLDASRSGRRLASSA